MRLPLCVSDRIVCASSSQTKRIATSSFLASVDVHGLTPLETRQWHYCTTHDATADNFPKNTSSSTCLLRGYSRVDVHPAFPFAVTLCRTREVDTWGGQRDVGVRLHAAEDPSRAQLDASRSWVSGGAEGGTLCRWFSFWEVRAHQSPWARGGRRRGAPLHRIVRIIVTEPVTVKTA